MKEAIEANWITGLAALGATFLLLTGTAMMITGGEFDETGVRLFGAVGFLSGLALTGGLLGLRTRRLNRSFAYVLIGAGLVVLAVGFWWFVFVPPVIAVAIFYAGLLKGGLVRELS